jgi:hypothetical protein
VLGDLGERLRAAHDVVRVERPDAREDRQRVALGEFGEHLARVGVRQLRRQHRRRRDDAIEEAGVSRPPDLVRRDRREVDAHQETGRR